MQGVLDQGSKLTKMGADMGLMTKAMGMANAGNDKARQADTANALVPAKKKARAKLGKLYSWGSGDYGRLGHGDNLNQKLPKAVDVLRDKDVRKFACGARHCIALGSDGTVYSWGYGGDGQLGHGDFQIQTMPTVVKALQGEGVIDVSCGEKHSLALTSGGDVYSWGDGSLGQLGLGDSRKQHTPSRIMELAGKMILQCSAGHFHSACVEDTGAVYSWGAGQSGRLGIGDEANVMTPTLVEELQDAGIQTVRCFAEHTMAINVATEAAEVGKFDEHSQARLVQRVKELEVKLRREVLKSEEAASLLQQGKSTLIESQQNVQRLQAQNDALLQERVELYMKMQSLENQLATATSDKENLDKELMALVSMPTKLAEITSQGVRQIATGKSHVLALSDTGDVYAWGSGSSGQLGLGRRKNFPSPQLVWGMMRKGVRQIGAGDYHSAALTYNGMVYTWGSSSYGQLGHGNKKTQLSPKPIEGLDAECRERSATVRLIGCGKEHTVAVLSNGELYMWGRASFGKLGRTKSDLLTEPQLVEALWRRDVHSGEADKKCSLNQAEISELLEQRLDVHDILRYFPDIEGDPEAALFLSKAVANDLQERVKQLMEQLERARKEKDVALEEFIAEQERAFEEQEKQGLTKLQDRQKELRSKVEMHEKSLFYQSQVSVTLETELKEINLQIEKAKQTEESAIQQAKTADKAELAKALYLALESLRQAKVDKEQELVLATKQASLAQEDLEKVQRDLSLTRVEIKKHEKLGHKKSIDHLRALVAEMSALSQRLNETSLENIDPALHGTPSAPLGIRQLIELSNADIDRICTQAATFASDDHVDVEVRQQLATMLFDNAEMRKQLNAYTEGILMQTMERLDQLGANDSSKQLAGPMGGMALPDAKRIADVTGAVSGLLKGPAQKV